MIKKIDTIIKPGDLFLDGGSHVIFFVISIVTSRHDTDYHDIFFYRSGSNVKSGGYTWYFNKSITAFLKLGIWKRL